MAWAYQVTTAGTITLPTGSRVLAIRCQSVNAGGTLSIFGGAAIPVVGSALDRAPIDLHGADLGGLCIASGTGAGAQIVTVLTESTLVIYDTPRGV